mgnify:CR=1 FL=1
MFTKLKRMFPTKKETMMVLVAQVLLVVLVGVIYQLTT